VNYSPGGTKLIPARLFGKQKNLKLKSPNAGYDKHIPGSELQIEVKDIMSFSRMFPDANWGNRKHLKK